MRFPSLPGSLCAVHRDRCKFRVFCAGDLIVSLLLCIIVWIVQQVERIYTRDQARRVLCNIIRTKVHHFYQFLFITSFFYNLYLHISTLDRQRLIHKNHNNPWANSLIAMTKLKFKLLITARKRSLGQGSVFNSCVSCSFWGPLFLVPCSFHGISVSGPMFLPGGSLSRVFSR